MERCILTYVTQNKKFGEEIVMEVKKPSTYGK
jgi:hypothetical protein